MYDCPKCGDPLADTAVICNACKWEPPGQRSRPKSGTLSVHGERAAEARRLLEAKENQPTAFDLSDQGWYNVCKFFPTIAERCSRPRPVVGPHNPLDARSSAGPLLRGYRAPRGPSTIPISREPGEEG